MIGSHGIPDFIGDKYCEKNICTHCMYVYSVWDKYGRKLYHDE